MKGKAGMAARAAGKSAMNNRILLRLLLGFPKHRERHCGTTARAQLGTEQLEPRALLSATPTGDLPVTDSSPSFVMPVAMPMQEAGYSTPTLSQENVAPILWGEGLSDPGQPSAWDQTGMPLGEFHSLLNFSKRDTIDPLLAPGNPNFWHAHDFFVNPSVSENATLASLMQAGESAAAPTNNLSVYWVPSLMNTTTGDFVTPLDSSIAYYAVQKPLEPSKIVDMPAGLSIIAGSAMPSERQSTAVMFWNYIGTSTQYDHIPQGDEWQDLPLQAVIMFPQFWDGKSLEGTNFKDHMAYDRGGDGGPSSHPYLLPELQLQIHYGHVPEDASLVLTSDSMTADRPDYAPGWSMHADFIHTPWPERDAEGNLYDGFARRVNDNLRWPTVAGTDGNAARPNPMGLQQPFTPAPLVLNPTLPGIDSHPVSDQPPADVPRDVPAMGPHFPGTRPSRPLLPSRPLPVAQPREPQPESPAPAPVPDDSTPSPIDTPTNPVDAIPQLAFSLDWPGPDIWMVVGRTNALFGYAENIAAISSMSATIQNIDTGLYLRRDGRFGIAESFDIEINRNNGHWSLLHTPVAGGTYRLVVTAASVDGTTQSQTTTFNVHGELSDPSVQDPVSPPREDPIQSQPIFTADFENSGAGIYTRDQLRADWNTPAWSQGVDEGRVSLVEQESGSTVLAVEYPAGKYGTRETGAQWKLNFDESYTSVELSYDVQFEEGFDFVKGGKLPGLFGGEGNTGGGIPTGMDGFSARMMWRGNGRVVQYVYYPDQPEHFGHDMPWTDPATGEDLIFTPGTWHNVVHQLKLNTPGERNGVLRTYFDGQLALEVQGLRFRDTTDFAIDGMYFSTFFGGGSDSWSTTADETIYFDNFRISEITFEDQPQPVVPPEVAPEPVPSPNPTLPSVGDQPLPTTDVSLALAEAIADGRILASPAVGDAVPHRFDGTPLQPLTTSRFNQAVPSSDWWSSVVMPVFGDDFSAPLHAHPLTVQATSTGLLVGAPTETTVAVTGATTAEYKTPHRFDLQLELLQQDPASRFAVEEYGDWSFTGRWLGGDTQPTATLAQGSPVVWLDDVNFEQMVVVPTDGNADIEIGSNYAFVTVAGRTSLVLGPEGSRLEVLPEGIVVRGVSRGELAVGLLPESVEETRVRFLETVGNRLETTQFSWDTHSNPFDIRVRYKFGAEESSEVLLAAYPHLTRLAATPDSLGQSVGSSGYVSPRGELGLVTTTGFDIDVPARGVLPTLPAVLTGDQLNTLRDMVRNDPAAIDPAGTLNRYGDTYWAGKAMLKLSQLAQLAEITGQTEVRERILAALKNELSDWFTATGESGDKHFAYNAEWDTLQGYPDSFGSAGDLNDHHFHYGYFIHAAALVGSFDAEWAMNQKQMVDLLVADVAGTDIAGNMLPRLRSFSPMAGHSWASGHGAFASGNNHESSSESMNFATAVMLWGEITGDTGMTDLGQMLYSVEAEAISEYWFNRYGTVFPESFPHESLGMVWGDGGSHATWFSAEPEMIKGINFLPFHGGSLYLAEMARDTTALLAEIEQLGGGVIDDWPGIILQYEALVNPEAAANRLALGGIGTEEGQTMAQTYFWTTVLSNIGTPTSVIRGDHPLSAVFQKEGVVTYVAHNAGEEDITVLFNDDTSINVPAGETVTRQRLGNSDQLVDALVVDQLSDQPASEPTLPSTPSLSLVSSTNTVRLLVDSTTGLAFVQESDNEPLLIRRADDYLNGDVPLVRGTATLVAAARDDLGRIRVLDVSEWGAFAWILDDNGIFQAEEGPTDSTLSSKEALFQIDLDRDGVIGMSSTP